MPDGTRSSPEAMQVPVVVDGGRVYVFQETNDLTVELAKVAEAGAQVQACHNASEEK